MADEFTNLRDMFDGGGMGASGDEFQGGGLLSLIGNALFQPYGYRERQREAAAMRPRSRPAGLLDMQPMPPAGAAGAGAGMAGPGMPSGPVQPMAAPVDQGMTPLGGVNAPAPMMAPPAEPPMQYSGRGTVGMPMPPFAQSPEEQQVIEYLRSIGAINY